MRASSHRLLIPMTLMILLLSAARCTGSTSPDATHEAARVRWVHHSFDDYSIVISRSCECLPEMAQPAVVVVRNGVVQSRTYVRTGQPVAPEYAQDYPSIEGLFAKIEAGLATEGMGELSVDYHPVYGFPTRYVFGEAAVDAPVTFARDFEPL